MKEVMTVDPCNISDLSVYTPTVENPWDERKVQFLFRRIGFGIHLQNIPQFLQMEPDQVVDQLIEAAKITPLLEPEAWNDFTQEDYQTNNGVTELFDRWKIKWYRSLLDGSGVNEKLFLFWHNHFVTKIETYFCLPWMYEYHQIIHNHTFGSFKDFVKAMGKTPAMLFFLNGIQNTLIAPNENYARELYELFTLGRDNGYTQQDITETARALTGFQGFQGVCNPIGFVEISHDKGEKTIFDQTGNWGYDDVHDVLFEQRSDQIANFICEKLYQAFVSPDIDYSITAELAQTFKDSEFALEPVYKQLFKSNHFFNQYTAGSLIKSPLEFLSIMLKELNAPIKDETLWQALAVAGGALGQNLYSPIDVAGWPGDKTWIDTEKILLRWAVTDLYLVGLFAENPEYYREFAITLTDNSQDVEEIVDRFISYFTSNGFHNEVNVKEALDTLKSDIPQNYFDDGSWNLNWDTVPAQIGLLLIYIFKSPEFQLH